MKVFKPRPGVLRAELTDDPQIWTRISPSHSPSRLPTWNGRDAWPSLTTRSPYLGTQSISSEPSSNKRLQPLDIAILGFPYDTSTSYRPGARFGPRGIRAGSSREKKGRSYNTVWGVDPYEEGLEIVDCGDVPITPFDAQHAFKQMEQAYRQVLYHPTSDNSTYTPVLSHDQILVVVLPLTCPSDQWEHPRIISLGGDHSIVLPILRSLKTVYGPVSVIHLDSHLDT